MAALREESYERKQRTVFRKLQNQLMSKERNKRQGQEFALGLKKLLVLAKFHGFLF